MVGAGTVADGPVVGGAAGVWVPDVRSRGGEHETTDDDRHDRRGDNDDDRPAVTMFGFSRSSSGVGERHGRARSRARRRGRRQHRLGGSGVTPRTGSARSSNRITSSSVIVGHLLSARPWSDPDGLESAVLAGEVPSGTVQSLPRRVELDPEHGGHGRDREVLPCHETKHFGIGISEYSQCRGDEAQFVVVDDERTGGSRGPGPDRAQPVEQATSAVGAAPLVADDPIGDAVHPQQRRLAVRHIAEAAPHGQERVRDRVVDRIRRHPPAAVFPDRSLAQRVELDEPGLINQGGAAVSAPPDAHVPSMPGCRGT